ncbi:MAG: ABC transporter ATP-binding protein [Myxococcales bacterium]|nr:ABC transporter ATP-binding protein [Myxococcales bacterium]
MVLAVDVSKSYGSGAGKTPVLHAVSLQVRKGEFLAMVGQSGSGKSTLLNIIGGLDTPDSGQVTVLGVDLVRGGDAACAKLRNGPIGFVFQSFNLLDHLSCLENVTVGALFGAAKRTAEVTERGMEVLRRVGLTDYAKRRPSELSGGQKQRVAIARALYGRPQLLLCDEPTGNLDSKTGSEIIELFRDINRNDGVTLMIVTHEKRVSSVATRLLTLHKGALVENQSDDGLDGGAA